MIAGYLDGRKAEARKIAEFLRLYTNADVAIGGAEIDRLTGDGFAENIARKLEVGCQDLIFVEIDFAPEFLIPEDVILEKTA